MAITGAASPSCAVLTFGNARSVPTPEPAPAPIKVDPVGSKVPNVQQHKADAFASVFDVCVVDAKIYMLFYTS